MSPVTSRTGRDLGVASAFVGLEGTRLVTTNRSADQWIDPSHHEAALDELGTD